MATRSSTRYESALSAARAGWHRWASHKWGWFMPVIVLVGIARGGTRAVRFALPALRWAGRGPVRVVTWTATVGGRRPVAFARWSGRQAREAFLNGMAAVADLAEQRGQGELANRIRVAIGRTGMTCGYCGAHLLTTTAEAHMDAHNAEATRVGKTAAAPPIATVTPLPQRPSPRPVRPAPAPAASVAAPAPSGLPVPRTPTRTTSTSTAPTGTTSTSTGGTMSDQTGTTETVQLMRAANNVGAMDPQDAWELDAQLIGMSRASLVLTENLGQYIETLDRIKVDPRVTAQAGVAVGQVAELVRTFAQTRQTFRTLYAAQFAAAEQGVRQVVKKEFFDPRRAA